MLSQAIHQYNYGKLLTKVRQRSAILIFFAFAAFFAISPPQNQEICNNGIDDNLNGFTDCQDPACKGILELCPEADPR